MIEGVEADDVIGTLARAGGGARRATRVISTGDKDLAQLVDEQRHAGQHDEQRDARRRRACVAKFGVPPDQIVDYLALIGDAVDNVPGVRQGRPEDGREVARRSTARSTAIVAHADEIGGVVGENLRAALDWLPHGARAASR
ncbi:MAG: hypothetical protein MZV65_48980 [Chromatiales bacterium]|nr:hypothetical protein [Chromatiales bacterium]